MKLHQRWRLFKLASNWEQRFGPVSDEELDAAGWFIEAERQVRWERELRDVVVERGNKQPDSLPPPPRVIAAPHLS